MTPLQTELRSHLRRLYPHYSAGQVGRLATFIEARVSIKARPEAPRVSSPQMESFFRKLLADFEAQELHGSLSESIADAPRAPMPNSQESSARLSLPSLAEFLLAAFGAGPALLGDMEEKFFLDYDARGFRRARLLYWAGVLRSIGPLMLVRAKKLGVIALLIDVARRIVSS